MLVFKAVTELFYCCSIVKFGLTQSQHYYVFFVNQLCNNR